MVLLSGEAGIGKSSLVAGLRDHVRQEEFACIAFRCSPYHTNSAFYPIIEYVQRALGWQPKDTEDTKLEKLEQGLRGASLILEETVPLVAALLSLPLSEGRYPELLLSPQEQRQQTQDVLVSWILEKAEQLAVLAVWEDLHWADPSTLEILGLVLEQTPTAPILHVLTYRPEFEPPWSTRSHMTPITLNRLEPSQVEALARREAHGKSIPSEVMQHIIAKTDGVPLYIEELTKMLLNSDLLREEADQYVLTRPLLNVTIPDTLQDSLMARLDQMNAAKEVAQLGAVLGREFPYEMLQAISSQDEETVQASLAQLVEGELLYQRGRPPRARYIFKHALIQDAAYASLLKSKRQQLHQRIAQVFKARFPETIEAQPALLAHHYAAAELFDQASHYWHIAGQRAGADSANREAVACFEQALMMLKQLPNNREQIERELALLLALRETLFPLREFDRALACLQEAEKLAQTQDDHHSLGNILCYQGLHLWLVNHDHAQALNVCQRALQIAMTHQDAALLALARDNLGRPYVNLGAYTQAMDIFDQNIELLTGDLQYERYGMALFLSVSARCFYSQCCAEIGMFAEGQQRIDEAIRIAEAKSHPHSLIRAYVTNGSLALRQGCLSRAGETLERALRICREADIPLLLPGPMFNLGAVYALAGRLSEALDLQEQVVEQNDAETAMRLVLLGETYLLSNRLEDAKDCVKRALTFARAHNERACEAWGLRLSSAVVHQSHTADMMQAEALCQEALHLAKELGMKPLQTHCHHDLGLLYSQIGQVEQARAELSMAIEMYRDMEMTFWLPDTEAALADVE